VRTTGTLVGSVNVVKHTVPRREWTQAPATVVPPSTGGLDGPVVTTGASVSSDSAPTAGDSSAAPTARSSRLASFIRSGGQRLLTPPIAAAALMLVVAGHGVFTTSRHPDEDVYVWASGYLMHQIATLDTRFDPEPEDPYSRSHWDPSSDWSQGMGTSTRLIYGLGLVATPGTRAPELPYSWTLPAFQGPETALAPGTLRLMRLIAVLCGAVGIALVARRFGWAAVLGAAVILGLPGGSTTFSRAWAEGPLLLGFGLCALAYGTRWFAPALGLGVTFKLTALGLWPLILVRRGRVISLWQGLLAMVGVFVLLTPPSWVVAGPPYLAVLIDYRFTQWGQQSSEGAFLPDRYFWPFELAAVLAASWVASRMVARYRESRGRELGSTTQAPVTEP
jgi:hypothetical protein